MYKFIVLMGLFSLFYGCKKEENNVSGIGAIELVCRATWDGVPVVIGNSYPYPLDIALKFYELDYLMSNVRLVNAAGASVLLKDVALVSFTQNNTDTLGANTGITYRFEGITSGVYPEMVLGIGLDSVTNATKPQDYVSGHPLAIGANRYWDAWSSFIFSKIQGLADVNNNGNFIHPFSYHSGGSELYREVEFSKAIVVERGKTTRLVLDLDVLKLLRLSDGTWWDIENLSGAHTPSHPAMQMISDNYNLAFTLN